MNYYKHHLGDYAAATRHLSLLEHGVFRCLIDIYYINETPLPKDLRAVCRLVCARSKDERDAVETVLEEFFLPTDDGWRNTRCDLEILATQAKAEKNREIGKRGGRPRNSETQTVSENNPDGFHKETQTVSENNPSHKPLANSQDVNPTSQSVLCTQPELRETPAVGTRKGKVCGLLRQAGMSDAAPHYLDDATWDRILGKRTDEEIVEVAKAKMAARPGQRTGLKYIAPALLEDPQAIAISGQQRRTIHDEREAVSIGLTGRKPTHERQISNPERDITGESFRVA